LSFFIFTALIFFIIRSSILSIIMPSQSPNCPYIVRHSQAANLPTPTLLRPPSAEAKRVQPFYGGGRAARPIRAELLYDGSCYQPLDKFGQNIDISSPRQRHPPCFADVAAQRGCPCTAQPSLVRWFSLPGGVSLWNAASATVAS
jgi:hypothetical protein